MNPDENHLPVVSHSSPCKYINHTWHVFVRLHYAFTYTDGSFSSNNSFPGKSRRVFFRDEKLHRRVSIADNWEFKRKDKYFSEHSSKNNGKQLRAKALFGQTVGNWHNNIYFLELRKSQDCLAWKKNTLRIVWYILTFRVS